VERGKSGKRFPRCCAGHRRQKEGKDIAAVGCCDQRLNFRRIWVEIEWRKRRQAKPWGNGGDLEKIGSQAQVWGMSGC